MKAEVMKKALGMGRKNRPAGGLLVEARQQAFTVAKKGRKAFPDFSKNPRHFSKNFPALTLNFENFSDLFFCEQNPPPPKTGQTGTVGSKCRDLTAAVWSPAFTRCLVSRSLYRLKAGLQTSTPALAASRHTIGGESHPVAVSSSDFAIAILPPGFEPRNSAKRQQTSTIHRKLSANFRILPRSSAFFRVSGREGLRQKGDPAREEGSPAAIVAAGTGKGNLYRQSDPNRPVVGRRFHGLCNCLETNQLQIKRGQAS